MDPRSKFNIQETGNPSGQAVLMAHGFGCDQSMWRLMTPWFEDRYRVITFDLMGLGGSDLSQYDPARYADLSGYADDVLQICDGLELNDVLFVGHSVSSMIGALAAAKNSGRISALAMICPSPRYVNDDGYEGGFSEADIAGLLDSLESNYLGWAASMAPVIMGRSDRPDLSEELRNAFCRADPDIAARFARATFLADNRADLPKVRRPTLVLQSSVDAIAPRSVGEFVAQQLPDADLVTLDTQGHCPNLSAPDETARAILKFAHGLVSANG